MQIQTLQILGDFHPLHYEDALFYQKPHPDWLIAAVADGCSMGTDSHFASALLCKILQKIVKELPYQYLQNSALNLDTAQLEPVAKFIHQAIFKELKYLQNRLYLEEQELLSSFILLLYTAGNAWVNISGDGFLAFDKEIIEIDQDNKPDYMAYQLQLPYADWVQGHSQSFLRRVKNSFAISTDGISSYAKDNQLFEGFDSASFLLTTTSEKNLMQQHLYLEELGLKPNDDVALLRVLL